MRVAIVAAPYLPVPPNKYGGTELVIYNLINGLKEAGHTPILLGTADSTVDCQLIPIAEKSLFFPKHTKDIPAHKAKLEKVKRYTARKLREILPDIDIIHSHGFDLWNFRDFPGITTLHNTLDFEAVDYFSKRKDLNYVSISHNQQAAMPELNYVGTVYNGEDPDDFPLIEVPEDYVCFLGRFDYDKSPHLAVKLALNLGIKIKLAGKIDFRSEEYFGKEIEPFLKHPLVEYLGELNFEEKVELLSKAKCNLHPTSFREPFGLNVIEAGYCGTPTLATSRGAMPELIKHGKNGMLAEDYLEGRHMLKECFAMDRALVAADYRTRFNHKIMTSEYIEVYKRVIRLSKT